MLENSDLTLDAVKLESGHLFFAQYRLNVIFQTYMVPIEIMVANNLVF